MNSQLSENELRELLAAGYRYACALRINPADAEDLVQDGWVKVVKAYGGRPSKAVLFRTIRNLHIDQYRHSQRYQHTSLDASGHVLTDAQAEFAVLDVADAQLNRCLARLREAEREALFLTVVEGYTAEEVASMTQRPRGTVLSLVHRARMKMRNYLIDDEASASVRPIRRLLHD